MGGKLNVLVQSVFFIYFIDNQIVMDVWAKSGRVALFFKKNDVGAEPLGFKC